MAFFKNMFPFFYTVSQMVKRAQTWTKCTHQIVTQNQLFCFHLHKGDKHSQQLEIEIESFSVCVDNYLFRHTIVSTLVKSLRNNVVCLTS